MNETSEKQASGGPEAPKPTPGAPAPQFVAYPPYAVYSEQEIDIAELWRILVRQRAIVLGVTALAAILAIVYAFLATPYYEAKVVMVPRSDEQDSGRLASLMGQYGGLASLAGIDIGGGKDETAESIATLTSRDFTGKFIDENNLLPVLFDKQWDAEAKRWKVDGSDGIPSARAAFGLFNERIRAVSRDKQTGLVTLTILWKDRNLAAKWANALVARINQHRQEEAIAEARKSIAYLNAQLKDTNVVEIQQAIYRLIEAQTKTIMLASVRDDFAFKVIDPAVAPDEDEIVKPQRALVIGLGVVGGLLCGLLLAFAKNLFDKARAGA